MGFSNDEIVDVFRVIAVVLKLGNIKFVPSNNIDGTEGSAISNDYGTFQFFFVLFLNENMNVCKVITRVMRTTRTLVVCFIEYAFKLLYFLQNYTIYANY